MPTSDFWTLQREARLQDLCAQNRYTSTDMARLLGCGRGAIISKVGRMGLKLLPPTDPRVLARPGNLPPRAQPKPLLPIPVLEAPRGLPMEQLRDGMCRYPEGLAPPYSFCANPIEHGKPYCSGHCAVTFQKPVARIR